MEFSKIARTSARWVGTRPLIAWVYVLNTMTSYLIGSRLQKLWYGVVATTEGKRSVEGKGEGEGEGEGERKVLTVVSC